MALLGAACGGGSGKPRPDLVFVSTKDGVYDLYAMNADGSDQQRLATGKHGSASTPGGLDFANEPAWSHDGKRIAFVSTRFGNRGILVMDANGKDVRLLTSSVGGDSHPTWSPDGQRIAFTRGKTPALWVIGANGKGATRITDVAAAESDPAWSPDGKWIAFVRVTANTPTRELWLVHPDGTSPRDLTALGHSVQGPAWSPDGERIAFASDARNGHFSIDIVGVNGKGLTPLSTSSTDAFSPAWSPDGRQIAFDRGGAIVIASLDGGEKTVTNGKDNDSSPVWNPVPPPKKSGGSGY
jgi:TolB protein